MALRDIIFQIGGALRLLPRPDIYPFWASDRTAVRDRSSTELGQIFFDHEGRTIKKWVHYLDAYDRYFGRFRGTAVRMLEIGVDQGGSLEMWRRYFGRDASIFGIDINPECANRVDQPNQVRIGSQADPDFLRAVVDEMGGIDIVLDDGSHFAQHQRASFRVLYPLLSEGGIYAVEDLHSSYWPGPGQGGYRRKGSGIEFLKTLLDDMHAPYHWSGIRETTDIGAIHFFDSIAFVEKKKATRPAHLHAGDNC